MGFLDLDAGSVVSRRSSHQASPSLHRNSKGERDHHERDHQRDHHQRDRAFSGQSHQSHQSRHQSRHQSARRSHSPKGSGHFSGGFGVSRVPHVPPHVPSHVPPHVPPHPHVVAAGSRSIFFSSAAGAGAASSSSYYRRQPRSSFLHRTYRKLRRLLRDLVYYAKKHPLKVFMLAILPLITGGALTALLARFGLRLPPALERLLGVGARAVSGDNIGLVSDAVRMAAAGAGGAGAARSLHHLDRSHSHSHSHSHSRPERDYFARASPAVANSADFYGRASDGGKSASSGAGGGWGASLARFFS